MPPNQGFIEAPSLEGLSTKAEEDPSRHEMRLSPAGHQPSISWPQTGLAIGVGTWQMQSKMLRKITISLFHAGKILPTQNIFSSLAKT